MPLPKSLSLSLVINMPRLVVRTEEGKKAKLEQEWALANKDTTSHDFLRKFGMERALNVAIDHGNWRIAHDIVFVNHHYAVAPVIKGVVDAPITRLAKTIPDSASKNKYQKVVAYLSEYMVRTPYKDGDGRLR